MRITRHILLFLACVSCKPATLSPDELNTFIADEENGLKKSVESGGVKIDVAYRPTDLWVNQELGDEPVTSSRIDSLRNKYDDYFYFIVRLSKNNKEALHQQPDFGQYSELVQTLSYRMSAYTTLTTAAQDTIPVGDFMLNRTFGMNTATELLFVFNRERAIGQEWVQFNLNEFGLGTGNQRFRFETSDLLEAPSLAFYNK